MRAPAAFLLSAAVGVAAAALVPYVHPFVHEGEAMGAALAGLLLAALSTRLWRSRSQRKERAARARRERRLHELSA